MKFKLSLIVIICFTIFFVFGFLDNLKGPVLPEIFKELKISYTAGGSLVFSSYLGFLFATFLSGYLADRIGNKKTLILSTFVLAAGIILYISFKSYYLMLCFIFIFGLGLGAIELTGNKIIIDNYHSKKGLYLNLLTFAYSVGAFISPFIAGFYFSKSSSWRNLYAFSLIPIILILIISMKIKMPAAVVKKKQKVSKKLDPVLYLLFFLMALYMMAEVGLVSWIVEFLQKAKGFTVKKSNLYLSLFFVGLGCGRLVGSFMVEKYGYIRALGFTSLFSVFSLFAGIFFNNEFAVLIPLVGLFYSIMFPTITALVSEFNDSGFVLGILFAFAGIGGMLGPAITGIANDLFTIKNGLYSIPVFCFAIFIIILKLAEITGKKKYEK